MMLEVFGGPGFWNAVIRILWGGRSEPNDATSADLRATMAKLPIGKVCGMSPSEALP